MVRFHCRLGLVVCSLGGMVDTIDLKSISFIEYRFKSDSEYTCIFFFFSSLREEKKRGLVV